MFDAGEKAVFMNDDFNIITIDDDLVEVESKVTGQCWMVRQFDRRRAEYRKFPPLVLFHKHNPYEPYHVHFVYEKNMLFWRF